MVLIRPGEPELACMLLMFVVGLGLGLLFGSGGTPVLTLSDVLKAIGAGLATLAGAYFAFRLASDRQERDDRLRQARAGNLCLADLRNAFDEVHSYCIRAIRSPPDSREDLMDRAVFMDQVYVGDHHPAFLHTSSLEFMLDAEGERIIFRLDDFRYSHGGFRDRNGDRNRLVDAAIAKCVAKGFALTDMRDFDKLQQTFAPHEWNELCGIGAHLIETAPLLREQARELFLLLRAQLQRRFPEHYFVEAPEIPRTSSQSEPVHVSPQIFFDIGGGVGVGFR